MTRKKREVCPIFLDDVNTGKMYEHLNPKKALADNYRQAASNDGPRLFLAEKDVVCVLTFVSPRTSKRGPADRPAGCGASSIYVGDELVSELDLSACYSLPTKGCPTMALGIPCNSYTCSKQWRKVQLTTAFTHTHTHTHTPDHHHQPHTERVLFLTHTHLT